MTLERVLPYAIVPGVPGVYVCGCLERWVSIYLQSVRALNLAWALERGGRIEAGARVCVVGGGFAGLAVAAGLGRRGMRVTLVESNRELLATQRRNRVRWIHPHIHEWPRPGSREPRAGLPLLDWTAGVSADVAAQILAGFEREIARSGIDVRTGVTQVALADEPWDAVVLALGVGIERSFGALPLASYWADEGIATVDESGGPRRRHLVTGIGEGGVIDALALRLRGFAHAELAAELAAVPGMKAVEDTLLGIERELEHMDDDEANRVLAPWYLALPVPEGADAVLRRRLRPDTRVVLNGPEPFPLASRADILNRFLISRLVALGELDYLSGKIVNISQAGDGYDVVCLGGEEQRFDRVNIRHGTVPALRAGFPQIWEKYQPVRAGLPHLTPVPYWPAAHWDGV